MSMTRRDFEGIAKGLKAAKPKLFKIGDDIFKIGDDILYPQATDIVWQECCTSMADYLATTNPAFDRAKFLKACGLA